MAGYESVRFAPGRFDLEALGVLVRAIESLRRPGAWTLFAALFGVLLALGLAADRSGLFPGVGPLVGPGGARLGLQAAYFALQGALGGLFLGLAAPRLAPHRLEVSLGPGRLARFALACALLWTPARLAGSGFEALWLGHGPAASPGALGAAVALLLAGGLVLSLAQLAFWTVSLLLAPKALPLSASAAAIRGGRRAWLLAQAAALAPVALALSPLWAAPQPGLVRESARALILTVAALTWFSVTLAMYRTRVTGAAAVD